ncbi:MAG: GFA family protein [Paracoccaceae bacterium]
MHKGSCQCGAVSFRVAGDLPPPNACHCTICRKQSGHVFASTEVKRTSLAISGAGQVTWYQSSPKVRRGFCAICGSSLFWDPPHRDWIAVAMGAFDGPTGTRMNLHIFVAEMGDYYDIADGLPQNER